MTGVRLGQKWRITISSTARALHYSGQILGLWSPEYRRKLTNFKKASVRSADYQSKLTATRRKFRQDCWSLNYVQFILYMMHCRFGAQISISTDITWNITWCDYVLRQDPHQTSNEIIIKKKHQSLVTSSNWSIFPQFSGKRTSESQSLPNSPTFFVELRTSCAKSPSKSQQFRAWTWSGNLWITHRESHSSRFQNLRQSRQRW